MKHGETTLWRVDESPGPTGIKNPSVNLLAAADQRAVEQRASKETRADLCAEVGVTSMTVLPGPEEGGRRSRKGHRI